MDEIDEESFTKRFQHSSEKELEAILIKFGRASPQGRIAYNILTERRRELWRSARIIAWATVVTAGATVLTAAAALIAIYFQYCQTQTATQ